MRGKRGREPRVRVVIYMMLKGMGVVCVTVFLKKELLLERTSMIAHTHTNMDYMTNWLVYKNAQHC